MCRFVDLPVSARAQPSRRTLISRRRRLKSARGYTIGSDETLIDQNDKSAAMSPSKGFVSFQPLPSLTSLCVIPPVFSSKLEFSHHMKPWYQVVYHSEVLALPPSIQTHPSGSKTTNVRPSSLSTVSFRFISTPSVSSYTGCASQIPWRLKV